MITQKVYATDIEDRIDPHFYKHKYLEVANRLKKLKTPTKRVDSFSDVICGPFGSAIKVNDYTDNGIPLIRIENIDKTDGVSSTNATFINEKLASSLKRYIVNKGDLVISQRGTLGLSGVIRDDLDGAVISANLIAIKNLNEVIPDYLQFFFNSNLGQIQLERRTSGQVQTKITTEDIKTLLVPIPSKEIQQKIVNLFLGALKDREEKLKQADELLNSIDSYVRQQLGIGYTEPEEEKIYMVNSQDLQNNRHDPYYYNPKFAKLLRSVGNKLKMASLYDIAEGVFNGNTPAKENYTDEGKPIVKVSCLKKNKIEWSNLAYAKDKKLNKHIRDNDILLLSSAHQAEYLGKNPCLVEIPNNLRETNITFVGELICIRPNTKLVNPYYLLAILRLEEYHQLINREKRGQTSHIYPDDLEKIQIPLVGMDKQDAIAQEFKSRINKAEQLKTVASKLLEEAKKKVEEMILN